MEEATIHLLIVDESSEHAETVANVLRTGGLVVRTQRVEDAEEMQLALDNQRWDIILSAPKLTHFGAQQALDLLRQAEKDIPVIVVANGACNQSATEVMRFGALDLVQGDHSEHLQLVVQREYRNLIDRREHRQCRKLFRDSEKRCRSLIENSRDAITYVHEGMHINANPVYLDLFGYADTDEIEGMPIMDMVAPDDHSRFKEFLRNFSRSNGELKGEIQVRGTRTDGTQFDALMEFSPATIDGEACTQIIIRRQASQELEDQLRLMSKQDLLTGLYNRQHLHEELDLAVNDAALNALQSALLYIELDKFDSITEDVGIAASDLVLGDIAKLIQDKFPQPHVASRFDGPVFVVLAHEPDTNKVETIADELRQAIGDHIAEVDDRSVTTTCSIGISTITESANDSKNILRRASHACKIARSDGGNAVAVFSAATMDKTEMDSDAVWLEQIRENLEKGGFRLVYQPIVSLHGDTSELYEVFIRMLDKEDRLVLPNEFLPAAEKADLMGPIDRWVIEHAIDVLARERAAGKQLNLFIKLSSASLQDKTMLPWLSETLKAKRVAGDALTFEVAESTAMTHLAQAKGLFNGLKQLRCRVALDHFGNGLNSSNALKHLNVDYLKIDGALVQDLSNNEKNQATVKSITEMSHSMGKHTIAEFVQDANSLAVLWQCGINYIQGYFLQEPSESLDYDFSAGEM